MYDKIKVQKKSLFICLAPRLIKRVRGVKTQVSLIRQLSSSLCQF